ncbi:MAG: tetratricopeptide repeat protein [Armatimonadetes bacterium]|nr:tetratricopeptide repeat protein [Armatimonadota bacterium]
MRLSKIPYLIALLLVVLTYVCYQNVSECGFVHFDDDVYVINNPHIQGGFRMPHIHWAFTNISMAMWQPMVWLSYMIDFQLNGLDPAGFHQTNLLLHIANVVLLFALLFRATRAMWSSSLVAALFAVHPQHVESVAWIAERKDVLSTLFWFSATLVYVWYTSSPTRLRYLLLTVLYAIGLMAKSMLVTLPLTLLLLDLWPLRRLQAGNGEPDGKLEARPLIHLIWEKTPLFVLAAVSCVITYLAQKSGGAVDTEWIYPLGVRIANAVVSYWVYIQKTLWPVGLACFYPHPRDSLPEWKVVLSTFMLVLATYAAIRARHKYPYLTVGWLWFLITLVPVIGLVQIGMQALADRYTYVPHIGLFIVFVWGARDLLTHRIGLAARVAAGIAAAGILIALGLITHRQVGYWRNDITLFSHAVEVVPGNFLAHDILGTALSHRGDVSAAIAHYRKAIQIEPDYLLARRNLMSVLIQKGKLLEAIECLKEALKILPNDPDMLTQLAILYLQQSKLDAAEEPLKKALRISPNHAGAHHAYGVLLAERRRIEEAISHFARAVRLAPGNMSYRKDLEQAQRIKEASTN